MAVAFQINEFQTTLKTVDGRILRSNSRPPMSFDYEVLTFTTQEKSRFWAGQKYNLSDEEILEVQSYVDSVEADPALTGIMTQIHQSKSILASTDWAVIKSLETGIPVPEHITKLRTEARKIINDAEAKL